MTTLKATLKTKKRAHLQHQKSTTLFSSGRRVVAVGSCWLVALHSLRSASETIRFASLMKSDRSPPQPDHAGVQSLKEIFSVDIATVRQVLRRSQSRRAS